MQNKASLFVIAAPSGAGKTTLVKAMVERHPELRFSVSYTSREQRKNEVPGQDYIFVAPAEFLKLEADGELLESALVFDNHYGTSRSQVEGHLTNGDNVILEIDWQGAQQVRRSMPECISIFILPPSRAELARRLRARRTDSDAVIERRLHDALGDMSHWDEFDYCIINDELEVAVAELEAIFADKNEKNHCNNPVLQHNIQRILAQP
jgi:guanylate kinase